jgi:hypothetical protein
MLNQALFHENLQGSGGLKKAVPVTSLGGQEGCETSRLPKFLENRLTGGGEVVSLTRLPPFNPRKILILISVRD